MLKVSVLNYSKGLGMLQFIFTNYYVEFSIKKCAWQKMKQGAYKTKMIRIQGCAIVTSWMCMM